ncbi:uncharacterized protein ATNIH1004_004423 [Aspergillus tanneri]|uniref:Calcineurin-like phosphoesterase domain-containing protein n=1 Tax=Aspergillus tanneri TaxID=1220188 RepID=A0A5M9MNH9_9EURO|nr:uncharacterized protein ATNIH1004_004423 [Aspergillus tanneri]KAA8648538.1 hypothetical protein ATNIH1004_004423 [Aspergillus tanneri]
MRTRICMISDTHTYPPNPPSTTSNPYRHPLPEADVLLHAGDLTKVGRKDEHELMVSMLKNAPAELKIIIAGNHDITLDEEYYTRVGHYRHRYRTDHTARSATAGRDEIPTTAEEGEGPIESPAEIKALYTGPDAVRAGIRYMEGEGTRRFRLSNGAVFSVYTSPYTPEFCQWAFAYNRDQDRFNPPTHDIATAGGVPAGAGTGMNPVPGYPAVDIMLTHGPPYGILDQVVPGHQSVGCEHLYRATERAKPRLHVFGHIHEGYGATRLEWSTLNKSMIQCDRTTTQVNRCVYVDLSSRATNPLRVGQETLFVNASVVTVQYEPVNAPWVVDLDLPKGE